MTNWSIALRLAEVIALVIVVRLIGTVTDNLLGVTVVGHGLATSFHSFWLVTGGTFVGIILTNRCRNVTEDRGSGLRAEER